DGAFKCRPMRTIGCLQFGHGKGRSGTLLSQLDEPGCLNVLRQAKQAKCTLFVAVGTPGPLRIPAIATSTSAALGAEILSQVPKFDALNTFAVRIEIVVDITSDVFVERKELRRRVQLSDVTQPLIWIKRPLCEARSGPHLLARYLEPAAIKEDAAVEEVDRADFAANLGRHLMLLEHLVESGNLDNLVRRGHLLVGIILLNRDRLGHD